MPPLADLPSDNPLPRTALLADAAGDEFFNPNDGAARTYVSDRTTVASPPGTGHFVIGQTPGTSLTYIFSLIDDVYQPCSPVAPTGIS